MNVRFAVIAAGSLFIASTAYAGPPTEAGAVPKTPHQEQVTRGVQSEHFNKLDQNRDGAISQEEGQAETALVKNWGAFDRNQDQQLDIEEFAAFEATQVEAGARGKTEAGMPSTKHQEETLRGEAGETPDTHEGDH